MELKLPKRAFIITAISFFLIAIIILFNALQGITGFAVFEDSSVNLGWFIAIWFVVAGISVIALEKRRHQNP
jgi:hypothetical protein